MRRSSLTAVAVLTLPITLAAQRPVAATPAGPRVGILAGLSSATIGGSDLDLASQDEGFAKKRRNGLVAGVYAVVPLAGSPLALRPELLYAQRGVGFSGIDNSSDVSMSFDASTRLDYLEVPVLLQLGIPTSAAFQPALYVGPSVAYRVHCSGEVTEGGVNTSTGCDDTGDSSGAGFRKFDLSGVVGGQLGFVLGGRSVGVGVRYTHGFTNLINDTNIKNRTLSVYGSLDVPFGH